ncbi:MAG: hypothetical protein V1736_04345 [Pseudomonadota bacterium]
MRIGPRWPEARMGDGIFVFSESLSIEVAMTKTLKKIKLSEARSKLTQLQKILKPGEVLQLTRRGKPYARIELIEERDRYQEVLDAIEALPEPEEQMREVASNYKSLLYGKGK